MLSHCYPEDVQHVQHETSMPTTTLLNSGDLVLVHHHRSHWILCNWQQLPSQIQIFSIRHWRVQMRWMSLNWLSGTAIHPITAPSLRTQLKRHASQRTYWILCSGVRCGWNNGAGKKGHTCTKLRRRVRSSTHLRAILGGYLHHGHCSSVKLGIARKGDIKTWHRVCCIGEHTVHTHGTLS